MSQCMFGARFVTCSQIMDQYLKHRGIHFLDCLESSLTADAQLGQTDMGIIQAQFRADALAATKDQKKQDIVPWKFVITNKGIGELASSETNFF